MLKLKCWCYISQEVRRWSSLRLETTYGKGQSSMRILIFLYTKTSFSLLFNILKFYRLPFVLNTPKVHYERLWGNHFNLDTDKFKALLVLNQNVARSNCYVSQETKVSHQFLRKLTWDVWTNLYSNRPAIQVPIYGLVTKFMRDQYLHPELWLVSQEKYQGS